MSYRYATREAVKAALDVRETARADALIDDALAAAVDQVEALTRCVFRPLLATKRYDWPSSTAYANTWRLWLDQQPDQLIALDTIVSGGTVIPVANAILQPSELGPPYNCVEINMGTSSAWNSGTATWQQSIALTGTWGFGLDYAAAGAVASVPSSSSPTITCTDSASVGVGDLIKIDTEWINVLGKRSVTTGQTITANLTATLTADGVGVADGTAYTIGETLTVDTERMLIVDVVGNTLVVKRGFDGSTLAAHTLGAVVFASRVLVVERGVQGSVAASHASAAPILRHDVPALIRSLSIAEALNTLLSRRSGYARTVGSGDNEQEASGAGLRALRKDAMSAYARTLRKAAI